MINMNEYDKSKLLGALSDIYISIFLFDLRNNDLLEIKSNKFIDKWASEAEGAQEKTNNVMKNITFPEHLEAILEFSDFNTLEERMQGKNNISIVFEGKINGWCRARFIAVDRDEDGSLINVLHVVECINEEKIRENHLLYLSQTDLMTGIHNRGFGEASIREAVRNKQKGVFLLFDVDRFKSINDRYGHDIGDKVLIEIADIMKKLKGDSDIIMRLGGDEFAMYIMNIDDESSVNDFSLRLFSMVDKITDNIPEIKEKIGISVGAAFYHDAVTFDELYKIADKGVYTSKRCKGSSISFV